MDSTSPAYITAEMVVAKLLDVDSAYVCALADDPRRRLVWGIERNNSILFSIDADGELQSQGRLPGWVRKPQFASCDVDGIVYFFDEDSWRIVGVDTLDMSEKFSYKPDGSVDSLCAATGGGVVIAAVRSEFLEVYRVDGKGKTVWSSQLPFEAVRYIRFGVDAFLAGSRAPILVSVQPLTTKLIGFDRNGNRMKATDWVARNRKSATVADSSGQPYQILSKCVIDISSGPVAQSVMMLYRARLSETSERSIIFDWDAGSEPWARAILPEFDNYTSIAYVAGTSICAVGGTRVSDGRSVIWMVKLSH